MEPIISKLNTLTQKKISNFSGFVEAPAQKKSLLGKTFNQTLNDKIYQKAEQMLGFQGKNEMTVLPGNQIKIERKQNLEANKVQAPIQEGVSDMFSSLNKDLNSMDSLVETLSMSSNIKTQDILRIQIVAAKTGIIAEVASKVADKGSQTLQTLMQTQIG